MTILWVTLGMPYPPDAGFRQHDYYTIREAARAARVILFAILPPAASDNPGDLRDHCARVETWRMPAALPPLALLASMPAGAWRNYYPEAAARLQAIAAEEHPDLLQVEQSLMAGYVRCAPSGCPAILVFHNITAIQYRRFSTLKGALAERAVARLKSALLARTEAVMSPRFDCCITVSGADAVELRRLYRPRRVEVVDNGIDCQVLRPLPVSTPGLVFVGVMNYPPNSDGAQFFCESVLPRIREEFPTVPLAIVGHDPSPEVRSLAALPHVTVTGSVPRLEPYYEAASIAIVPLRAGGGTRLKILEAMAMGRPVVSTTIGCEGIEAEHGRHLLIADTAVEFATAVRRLLRDPGEAASLARRARQLVEQRYDWRVLGERLARIQASVAAGGPV